MNTVNTQTLGKVYMAFGKTKESTEAVAFKKFMGIGAVKVLAVNPTKTELEKLYNTTLERGPEYFTEKDGVKGVRLDFIIATDEEKHPGQNYIGKYSIFLENKPRFNQDNTKVQVIDKFGETAWISKEEAKAGIFDESKYKRFSTPFRPAFVGEDTLIQLLKTQLCIDDSTEWKNGTWVRKTGEDLENAVAGLEKITEIFTGNYKELREALALVPNNKIKLIFGIRTTDENKEYQTFYPKAFKLGTSDFTKMGVEITKSKEAGRFPNTEFALTPLQEYAISKTNFETPKQEEEEDTNSKSWFQ